MTEMVVDPGWVGRLRDAPGAVEMVSPDGQRLGTFYPSHASLDPSLDELMSSCPYSVEELDAMRNRPPVGREWKDIKRDLIKRDLEARCDTP